MPMVRVRTNNLSGVETTTGASVEAGGQRDLRRLTSRSRDVTAHQAATPAEPVVPAAQSPTNPEAQRIISELIAEGAAKEHAEHVWKLINEAAAEQRKSRPAFPGTRTGIDTNRWPLFKDEP